MIEAFAALITVPAKATIIRPRTSAEVLARTTTNAELSKLSPEPELNRNCRCPLLAMRCGFAGSNWVMFGKGDLSGVMGA